VKRAVVCFLALGYFFKLFADFLDFWVFPLQIWMSEEEGNVFYPTLALTGNWSIKNFEIQTAISAVPKIF